jgi:8-oxo-dGTP pyrophosphatase MutT (NUDIX family)
MEFNKVVHFLKQRLLQPLPGEEAHKIMSPPIRKPLNYYMSLKAEHKASSVLMLLHPSGKNAHLLFIQRTDGKHHSGQIAFPGGKVEENETAEQAALREANEETGINSEEVIVIGAISQLFIPVSNFLVSPFIGYCKSMPDTRINPNEVKGIFSIPLKLFFEKGVVKRKEFKSGTGTAFIAPYFDVEGLHIWGATAMMISELREIIALDIK